MQRLKSFQIWGFRLVDMISRIVGALVEPTPVAGVQDQRYWQGKVTTKRWVKFYVTQCQSGKIMVINGSKVVLSGTRRDNYVYSLDGHAVAGELNASVKEKDSLAHVWHKRLGHISEARLQVLEKQGLFGKKSLDLWGPSQVESLGGKRYFLSIVDDYSRRTGRTVKKLRTDNYLEFCNREFKQLCIESGIARHLTVSGTPQQNGLAERMNRTLMDKVRCLLIQSGLPKTFWAEATCTAVYLINRSPSTAIDKKTPMEMWSRHPSDYEMLRTFGCVAYSHVQQGKLEPRAVKCVLLGYPEGVKGYRLYRLDNESPKIVISRNVVFNESVMYKDTLKDSGADDMLIACKSKAEIGSTKSLLKREFDMKDLREAKKILDNGKSVQMPLGGHFKLSLKDCPIRDCDVEKMSKVPEMDFEIFAGYCKRRIDIWDKSWQP
nr:retrovirus-related Pol polyprotein from transposon TNT 1-94 [Tanacetum cinerariifolium]